MSDNTWNWLRCAILIGTAAALAGCPTSKRITIDGYNDEMFTGKRVMLIVPDAVDITFTDSVAFGAARGVSGDVAREQATTDLQTRLITQLNAQLDSNTVLSYREQPIGGMVPVSSTNDFTDAGPKTWDDVKRAGREGNIDYLIVLKSMTITDASSSSGGRGAEGIRTHYLLLDAQHAKTLTSGDVKVDVKELSAPGDAFARLADELVTKLPFRTKSVSAK